MTLTQTVLLVLSTARLTRFVVDDDLGRHMVVYPLVRALDRAIARRPWLAEGFGCSWCVSVYAATGCYVLYRLVPWAVVECVFWPLALSYVVGVSSRWLEG